MVKVCHVTSAHNPMDERIFYKECVSLARFGYEVYLVEAGNSGEKLGVHLIGCGEKPLNRFDRMTKWARHVCKKALEINADIYHLHDPELLLFAMMFKKNEKKVIFDSHEIYVEQIAHKDYLPCHIAKLISRVYSLFQNFILKRIDGVIVPCTVSGVNIFRGKCKKSAIISNAAMFSEFYDLHNENTDKNPRQVCYVGGLTEDRGITTCTKAVYKAQGTLSLAGNFSPSSYYAELKKLPESSCVEWHGLLNRKEVAELIEQSCLGLCVLKNSGQYSKIDTFGIKVYEYMSMGIPVVLNNSPYNVKSVERYNCGICVDPENVDEIASAIRYLLDNPDKARRMGENGRRAVREKFNWGVEEKKLFKLYEETLAEK